jgi:hypothetical protein
MKRILLILALCFSTLTFIQPASAADGCATLNAGLVADNNLTVTMKSIEITEKAGSNLLTISYNQLNATPDKKLDEGSFKLFFADGSSEPQYGGFNYFFPSDTRDRTYSWEYLKTKEPLVIEYNAGFFSAKYDTAKLNWVLPGKPCALTPTVPEVSWDGKQRYTSELDWKLCVGGAQVLGTKHNCGIEPDVAKADAAAQAAAAKAVAAAQAAQDKIAAATKMVQEKANALKSSTISCVKGKVTKKVTAVNPKCPAGYKKK